MRFQTDKWIKIPTRGSRAWHALMKTLVKAFNLGIVNIQVQGVDRHSFTHYDTRRLIRDIEDSKGQRRPFTILMANAKYDGRGIGVIMKDLQPYYIPFAKIAKTKAAKEFKEYIVMGKNNRRKRWDRIYDIAKCNPLYAINTPKYGTIEVLTYAHMTQRGIGKRGWGSRGETILPQHVVDKYASKIPKLGSSRYLAIGRNSKGRACLVYPHYSWYTYSTESWKKEGQLKVDSIWRDRHGQEAECQFKRDKNV